MRPRDTGAPKAAWALHTRPCRGPVAPGACQVKTQQRPGPLDTAAEAHPNLCPVSTVQLACPTPQAPELLSGREQLARQSGHSAQACPGEKSEDIYTVRLTFLGILNKIGVKGLHLRPGGSLKVVFSCYCPADRMARDLGSSCEGLMLRAGGAGPRTQRPSGTCPLEAAPVGSWSASPGEVRGAGQCRAAQLGSSKLSLGPSGLQEPQHAHGGSRPSPSRTSPGEPPTLECQLPEHRILLK